MRWSVQALHDEIERRQIATLHPTTVHRILDAADLHPHHLRYWRHTLVPDFEEKAASVLWYYERVAWLAERDELVVCVDEKTQIQALRRPVPDWGMRSGLVCRPSPKPPQIFERVIGRDAPRGPKRSGPAQD